MIVYKKKIKFVLFYSNFRGKKNKKKDMEADPEYMMPDSQYKPIWKETDYHEFQLPRNENLKIYVGPQTSILVSDYIRFSKEYEPKFRVNFKYHGIEINDGYSGWISELPAPIHLEDKTYKHDDEIFENIFEKEIDDSCDTEQFIGVSLSHESLIERRCICSYGCQCLTDVCSCQNRCACYDGYEIDVAEDEEEGVYIGVIPDEGVGVLRKKPLFKDYFKYIDMVWHDSTDEIIGYFIRFVVRGASLYTSDIVEEKYMQCDKDKRSMAFLGSQTQFDD